MNVPADEVKIWNPAQPVEECPNLLPYVLGMLKHAAENGAMLSMDSEICGLLLAEIERLRGLVG